MSEINLSHGSGSREMNSLIKMFDFFRGNWKNYDNDSATFELKTVLKTSELDNDNILTFTTDSFVVNPIFFPNANIGHLAFSGTINDLLVIGSKPLGLSLAFVIEEGFSQNDLMKIVETLKELSFKYNIPIVTGDTKVMEKGKIDKIIINTSGLGLCKKTELLTKKIEIGDKLILSGGLGEHAVALLSKRFNYETSIVSDSKPLIEEFNEIRHLIKQAKDPTRGGIASVLNEMVERNNLGFLIDEEKIPVKNEVKKVVELLGINLYELASEGRFLCIVSKENVPIVLEKLKKFNQMAEIIGEVIEEKKVILKTFLGNRILGMPSGRIVPRIC
ncbi:MAG: hydrogenase expression/formation protein HypE [Candidatus Woesearchaeota archaeon]